MNRLVSLLVLVFMATTSTAFFFVALGIWLLTFWWDRRRALLHRFTCFWASIYSWMIPVWPLTITGRENLRKGATYVMVSNHQSLLDVLMFFRLFAHFKWVAKIELFRIPFVGWNMRLNRYIPIRRGDPASAAEMFDAARRALARGSSVFIFPEGTRSPDGRIRRFKTGAFRLAQEAGVPLLPLAIRGTAAALPKNSLDFRGRHPVHVTVLPEIPYETFRDEPPEDLAQRIRERIARVVQGASGG